MPLSIPEDALFIVMANLLNPSMGEYVRLAQVNQEFRRVFLSNAAWAKFDVYGVRDEDHVYHYDSEDGEYELCGIAATFFNYLDLFPRLGGWYLDSKLSGSSVKLAAYVMAADPYSQLHALILLDETRRRRGTLKEAFFRCVPLIALDVWILWATHLREPQYYPLNGFFSVLPAPVACDKQVVVDLLRQKLIWPADVVAVFNNDRDINLVVAAIYFSRTAGWRLPSPRFLHDAEFVLEALDLAEGYCDEEVLVKFASHHWDHKPIVLKVVSMNGNLFEDLSPELRADREIVLAAAKRSPWILDAAPETLKNDREFILEAFEVQLPSRPVGATSRTDRDIVLQAVQADGTNLKWAPVEFRGDREIVLAAVQETGRALEYAAEPLRRDRGVVLCAVNTKSGLGWALRYASEALQNDRQLVHEAVKQSGLALEYASEALRADASIVLAAIGEDPSAFKYASAALRGDGTFVFSCLRFLRSLNGRQWADRSRSFWRFVSDGVHYDEDFTLKMIVKGVLSLSSVAPDLSNYRQLVLAAVQNDASELEYAPGWLNDNRDFMLLVVKQNGDALRWVGPRLQANKKLVLAAVSQSPSALRYASQELRDDPDILAAAQGRTRWLSRFRV